MGIPQKMMSTNRITVNGIDLYAVTDLVMRIRQGAVCVEVPLEPVADNAALMTIDANMACKLYAKPVELQILWKDELGYPDHTAIKTYPVDEIIGGRYD